MCHRWAAGLHGVRRAAVLLVLPGALAVALAETAAAQLITIRTVPIAQADQFDIFPSRALGMGGVSIAVPDTLLDPFVNPAKGSRLSTSRIFGSPMVYNVSSNAGGGRTLPIGALATKRDWFGGLAVALQQVDDASRQTFFPVPVLGPGVDTFAPVPQQIVTPVERSHGNTFAFAMLGRRLPRYGLSLGGSVTWAELHGVDGVDLLYAGSQQVQQTGNAVDLRLGVLKEWSGDRSLEAVLVHNRYRMLHDVTYLDFFWDPGTQRVIQVPRMEHNPDRTNTWGLHLEYERPLTATGWRIGWLATANRMSHPKIPNYEIMNVPRDPGYSSAFNAGLGVSRTRGPATFGMDVIYEPIWSHTWADAAEPVQAASGDTIVAGGRTVENRFRFSNALFRMGVSQELQAAGSERGAALQLGLVVRSVRYRLTQDDHVQGFTRHQVEEWLEWAPTWGLSLRFTDLEIHYRGRVTHGTGRPGVSSPVGIMTADGAPVRNGIIAAPSGPLTLAPVNVVTHQISFSLPLR